MTGITRVRKESIFSDLNHLKVVTSTSDKYATAFGFTEKEVRAGQKLINYVYPKSKGGYGYSWETAKKKMGYDTGGYTGNWGTKEGKLAFLHQKEIVLNAKDTENFLSAIEIVREIANKIDLNAASAMSGRAMQSGQVSDHSQTLEQHVEITASFPNATDHNEIEEAFKNLVNMASQHANTKRK